MPRYSVRELNDIAQALRDAHYNGIANNVVWWSTERRSYIHKETMRAMYRPLKEMPLFLEDEFLTNRIIAQARMKSHNRRV